MLERLDAREAVCSRSWMLEKLDVREAGCSKSWMLEKPHTIFCKNFGIFKKLITGIHLICSDKAYLIFAKFL